MNLGLDVDGVLVDVRTFQLREGKRYFEKKFGISIKNPDMFEVQDVFECTKKQREAFWIKYIWKYCLKEPMTAAAAACGVNAGVGARVFAQAQDLT